MNINLTPEEIEKQVMNMSVSDVDKLADDLKTIARFLAKEELKKALIRKMELIDTRLGIVEKNVFGKSVTSSIPKDEFWPSLSGDE
jgi:hypothetical protein